MLEFASLVNVNDAWMRFEKNASKVFSMLFWTNVDSCSRLLRTQSTVR